MSFSIRGMHFLATLRKERQDAVANWKPQFGPALSKAIFERKWLSKLNGHNREWPLHNNELAHVAEKIPPYLFRSFDLVTAFLVEATTLGFQSIHFTEEPESTYILRKGSRVCVNPFVAALGLLVSVNFYAKLEGEFVSKLPWRTEVQKERLREEFEDLSVKVFEGKEAGAWDVGGIETALAQKHLDATQTNDGPRQRRKWW